MADDLGHARGRWGALTRQATFAQLAGRAEEAARFGEQALRARPGDRRTGRHGVLLHVPMGAGRPRRTESRRPAWTPATRCGRCSRSSRPGHTPSAATCQRPPPRSATSACSTSPIGPAWKASPPPPSSSPSPAPTPNARGPTTSFVPTPAPTCSSPAAPPTTPPSTTTSARSPPPSATRPRPPSTTAPPSRCTNDSAPPAGRGCPSRPSPHLQPTAPDDERVPPRRRHLAISVRRPPGAAPGLEGTRDLATLIGARGDDVHVLTLLGRTHAPDRSRPGARRHGESGVQGPAGRLDAPDR